MKVALLGTGLMGTPMAERLLRARFQLMVHNRTRAKLADLEKKGALIAWSIAEAVAFADCIILMLADAEAIHTTLLNPKHKLGLRSKTIIQMGTISPNESLAIKKIVEKRGGDYLECPVLGSITEVKDGKLILMVGGTEKQFEHVHGVLQAFGPEPLLIGPVGQAAALKLAMNQLIASHITAFSHSLGLVEKFGIKTDTFMNILRQSSLYAPMFDKKIGRLLKRYYKDPNFSTRHMLKDVRLFIKTAEGKGMNASALKGIGKLLEAAIKKGLVNVDYSAIYEVIRK